MTAFALGPGVCDICVCPLRVEFIFHSPLALLRVIPTGLQSQMFWGLVFLAQDSWDGELRLLVPWKELLQL